MMLRFLSAAALSAAAMVPGLIPVDPAPEPPASAAIVAPAPAPSITADTVRLVVHAVDAEGRPVAFDGDVTISAGGAIGSTTVHVASGSSEQVSVPLTSGRIAWLTHLAIG